MSKKVLLIRFGAIGDVVVTTGLLRAMKKAGFEVHYLTGKAPSTLLQKDGDLDKLMVLEKKSYTNIFKLSKVLKKENYDYLINLHPSLRTKILCFLSKPKRILVYKKSYKYHAVENFFMTAAASIPHLKLDDKLELFLSNEEKEWAEKSLDKKTRICFNIGATPKRQGRRWQLIHWAELAKKIFDKFDVQIFVIGGQEDCEEVEKLLKLEPRIKSFAGKTTLRETAALTSQADIVISGDTGPLHIATALAPVCIGLYGCCSISRSGPYGKRHYTICSELSCAPCDGKLCPYSTKDFDDSPCMDIIKPNKVLKLIENILSSKISV